MYSKAESSNIKKEFWTTFGMYMKPVKNAEGVSINWVNYKTGIRHIYFRMDVTKKNATVAVELKHPDEEERRLVYAQFESLKSYFTEQMHEGWNWQQRFYDEDGSEGAKIFLQMDEVSIFRKETWPDIISFLKKNIIALDAFWVNVKVQFEH